MNTKYYYQKLLYTPAPNKEFTKRLHSAHEARQQRAHGALEDPTTLPQRSHSALLSRGLIFGHVQNNRRRWRSRRWHSAHTASTQRCWRLHSAHLGDLHFQDTMRML